MTENWQKNSFKISTWLLYLMAFLSFFSGWFLIAANYEWVRQNLSWIVSLNAPVIDWVAAFTLFFLVVEWFLGKQWQKLSWQKIPSELKWYLLFIVSAALSIFFAFENNYSTSFWHWWRFIIFSYLAYLVTPYLIANREEIIKNVLRIWLGVGIVVAVYGLVSLLIQNVFVHWASVQPFSIFGWTPLGLNHNQLAEVLVAIIPLGTYWSLKKYKEGEPVFKLYVLATLLMLLVCLLTLSRAAWIALAVQAGLAFVFYQKKLLVWGAKNRKAVYLGLLAAALAAGYMLYFISTSNIVSSSNSARLETTRIVFFYLGDSPLFGFGPGAYMQILANTRSYVLDFGDPLEAHGFVQKIAIDEGFVGLALFILFLVTFFSHLWQAQRGEGQGQLLARTLLITALGGVVFQLFNTEYFSAVMWMPMGIALAYARLRLGKIV